MQCPKTSGDVTLTPLQAACIRQTELWFSMRMTTTMTSEAMTNYRATMRGQCASDWMLALTLSDVARNAAEVLTAVMNSSFAGSLVVNTIALISLTLWLFKPPDIVVGRLSYTFYRDSSFLYFFFRQLPASSLNGTQPKQATCSEVSAI